MGNIFEWHERASWTLRWFTELYDRLDYPLLISLAEAIVKRQPDQAVAHFLGHGTIPRSAAELTPHLRSVQRHVVKDARNVPGLEVRDESLPRFQIRQQQVKQVVGLLAMSGHDRQATLVRLRPWRQPAGLAFPNLAPPLLNLVRNLQVRAQERRQQIANDIT